MSHQPTLLKIVNLIKGSSLCTILNFLAALLENHNRAALATKSPSGMRKILQLMSAHQIDSMAEKWALELSQKIYVNEIKTVIQKVHGLHFNACTATADDITNFSLEKIINTFHGVTPKTWALVQGLLDANREARQHTKLPKDTANYQKRHDPDADLGVNDAVEEGTSESESENKTVSQRS